MTTRTSWIAALVMAALSAGCLDGPAAPGTSDAPIEASWPDSGVSWIASDFEGSIALRLDWTEPSPALCDVTWSAAGARHPDMPGTGLVVQHEPTGGERPVDPTDTSVHVHVGDLVDTRPAPNHRVPYYWRSPGGSTPQEYSKGSVVYMLASEPTEASVFVACDAPIQPPLLSLAQNVTLFTDRLATGGYGVHVGVAAGASDGRVVSLDTAGPTDVFFMQLSNAGQAVLTHPGGVAEWDLARERIREFHGPAGRYELDVSRHGVGIDSFFGFVGTFPPGVPAP